MTLMDLHPSLAFHYGELVSARQEIHSSIPQTCCSGGRLSSGMHAFLPPLEGLDYLQLESCLLLQGHPEEPWGSTLGHFLHLPWNQAQGSYTAAGVLESPAPQIPSIIIGVGWHPSQTPQVSSCSKHFILIHSPREKSLNQKILDS